MLFYSAALLAVTTPMDPPSALPFGVGIAFDAPQEAPAPGVVRNAIGRCRRANPGGGRRRDQR
ncbi:protein of unknown function [Methylocella tundrae]|uniref:Uncharacterized protein n=1 Tax=Methylocella tundrae TaxID=227605 RepID=A0A4U8Z0D0_METTU|nr:protein of unknown function [Methylocella tundrae]